MWQSPIGSQAHMAAYKRHTVSESEKDPIHQAPHHTNRFHFLSLGSYRSKSQKLKNKCMNPNFFQKRMQAKSMEIGTALRDSTVNLHHWAFISAIQAPDSSLEATNPGTITEASLRRRGKERFTESEPVQKKKEKITSFVSEFKPRSTTESNPKISEDLDRTSEPKPGKITNLLLVSFKNNNEFQNDVEQRESVKLWFGIINPNLFWENFKIPKVYNVDSSL